MTIIYNPDINAVIVNNGIYTPEDIYQEDINNGWNVIQKAGSGYYLRSNLQVGQTNETHFTVENGFFQVGDKNDNKWIKLPNYYGKGFTIKNGHFKWYVDPEANWWYGKWAIENSKVEKYSPGIVPRLAGGLVIKDSIVMGRSIDIEYGILHLENSRIDLVETRFRIGTRDDVYIDNVTFYNGSDILFVLPGTKISNSTIKDVSRSFYLASDGMWAEVIDCIFEEKYQFNYDTNYLLIKYSFRCEVVDNNGNPIPNALVRLYDVNDNLVYEKSTDDNGRSEPLPILYKRVESKQYTEILYSPHKLVVTKENYPRYQAKFLMDRKIDKTVVLGDKLSSSMYTIDDIYNEIVTHRNTVEPKIDAIKNQTDKLEFNENNYVKSDAQNPEISNLDTTISSRASQASVDAIPTNPLLDNDTRLDNLDAPISSRSSHTPEDVWTYSNRELSNPDNYKADVSNLALESTVQSIKNQTDKLEFNDENNRVKAECIANSSGEIPSETEAQIDNIESMLTDHIEQLRKHDKKIFNKLITNG